jgi:hypothetical protein
VDLGVGDRRDLLDERAVVDDLSSARLAFIHVLGEPGGYPFRAFGCLDFRDGHPIPPDTGHR